MKFKEEVCGNCGFDLTEVKPGGVEKVPVGVEDRMVPYAECPQCHTNRIVVAPELAISPDPEPEPPVARSSHRRASEPEQPAEKTSPEEPGAEEKPSEE